MESFKYQLEVDNQSIIELFGINDSNLKLLKKLFAVDISYRDNTLYFYSTDENAFNKFKKIIDTALLRIHNGDYLSCDDMELLFNNQNTFSHLTKSDYYKPFIYCFNGRPIAAKTYNQSRLLKAIDSHDLVFAIGPAGTGKTFLAVAKAVQSYKSGAIKKIVLTRPAVEAGESLGFLPGDLKEKVDPYLMPLYDALNDLFGEQQFAKLLERGIIEIIPLAFMRGRTLNDAFIILDEAQNTTSSQMLMFLTRLGKNSKMLVNGDITQIDLAFKNSDSGLKIAKNKLRNIDEIAFVKLDVSDVVRSPLVQKVIEAYQEN